MARCYGFKQFKKENWSKFLNQKVALEMFKMLWRINKLEVRLDKEMRREVGKPLRKAEKLVKKAEKNNAKLANKDEKVRDPLIAKCKKVMKKKSLNKVRSV